MIQTSLKLVVEEVVDVVKIPSKKKLTGLTQANNAEDNNYNSHVQGGVVLKSK